jgi:hypothetical protein
MLISFMQNSQVKMTKQAYFEMCEALGNEPVESEIPVELEDFPAEVQEILEIYRILKDDWDTMNGNYLGKHLTGILDIFDIFEVHKADRKLYIQILNMIDAIRSKEIKKQQTTKP